MVEAVSAEPGSPREDRAPARRYLVLTLRDLWGDGWRDVAVGAVKMCPDCGVSVGDESLHDRWHEKNDEKERGS